MKIAFKNDKINILYVKIISLINKKNQAKFKLNLFYLIYAHIMTVIIVLSCLRPIMYEIQGQDLRLLANWLSL